MAILILNRLGEWVKSAGMEDLQNQIANSIF